jgi:hypothetical protein
MEDAVSDETNKTSNKYEVKNCFPTQLHRDQKD